jgi:hypothetical protein
MKGAGEIPTPPALAKAVADPDEAFGDVSALAGQERLPGSSPLLCRGFCHSENVAKLIGRAQGIRATARRVDDCELTRLGGSLGTAPDAAAT